MKNLRTPANIAIAAVLIGALAFLYAKTQGGDFSLQNQVIADLRELETLDAEWSNDTLRAKIGIERKYDKGNAPAEKISASLTPLQAEMEAIGTPTARETVTGIKAAVATKAELTQRFTQQNRLLREALLSVSNESAELLALLRMQHLELLAQKGSKNTSAAVNLSELGVRVNELLTETLKYNLLSDPDAVQRIESKLTGLTEQLPQYPGDLSAPVAALIEKFRGVQKQKAAADILLNDMAALPKQQRIAQAYEALHASRQQLVQSTDFYRKLLIAYSAALLAVIAWFAWRLVASYRLIQSKNTELEAANQRLEQRVNARTTELQDALSHLKESESALIQSEKMSSLGQMIAGVVHEINTPLAYVRNSLQALDEQIPHTAQLAGETRKLLDLLAAGDAEEADIANQYTKVDALCQAAGEGHGHAELAGVIKDGIYGIEQISEIVTNLKNFSRLDRSKVAHFNLNEGLDSTLVIARNLVKSKQVQKDYSEAAFVTGSPSQINQVFLNLISNAAQATGPDGLIRLSTRVEGSQAIVVVEDNGCGIPADVLPKIFDPFFTTKRIGEGTGLGLSIAYKIIAEHRGRIDVHSVVGQGTRFTITLPVDAINTTTPGELTHVE